MTRSSLGAALALGLIGCVPRSQPLTPRDVPTIVLDHGATELTDRFTWEPSLVELRDGRVLIPDGTTKGIWLVDVAHNSRALVARSGTGPTDIEDGTLLPGAAESAVYYDRKQRRFLVFSPAGVPAMTKPYGGPASDPFAVIKAMWPKDVDARGEIFGESSGIGIPTQADMMAGTFTHNTDSIAIERYDPATARTDTVAHIRSLHVAPSMQVTPAKVTYTMHVPDLRADDEWAALPDGRVAILRDGKYQVEFVTPGGMVTRGPEVPHTAIAVDSAEKQKEIASTRDEAKDMSDGLATRATGTRAGLPPTTVVVLEPASWPDTKAPYEQLEASPDGRLWVMTPTPRGEHGLRYDVLDSRGVLLAHVQTVPHEGIIGFGRGDVYTMRSDSTELEHLRRYVLPSPLKR